MENIRPLGRPYCYCHTTSTSKGIQTTYPLILTREPRIVQWDVRGKEFNAFPSIHPSAAKGLSYSSPGCLSNTVFDTMSGPGFPRYNESMARRRRYLNRLGSILIFKFGCGRNDTSPEPWPRQACFSAKRAG